MTGPPPSLREAQPLTWTFHRNTSRHAYNAGTAARDAIPGPPREHPHLPAIDLPEPSLPRGDLADLLRRRFSCRRFASRPVAVGDLARLLHAGYGVLDQGRFGRMEMLERPVPSGGGLYPLELFVVVQSVEGLEPGIYHYAAITHHLELIRDVLVPGPVREYLFMGQRQLADAPAQVIIVGVPERSLGKYRDRGYRYLLFEAGHVAQNVNLAALALGLGTCNIGGFFDQDLAALLRLDPEREFPLYGIAIGHPASGSREELRGLDD